MIPCRSTVAIETLIVADNAPKAASMATPEVVGITLELAAILSSLQAESNVLESSSSAYGKEFHPTDVVNSIKFNTC